MINDVHNLRADIILRAAQLAADGDMEAGERLINEEWPHNNVQASKRTNTKSERARHLADWYAVTEKVLAEQPARSTSGEPY